MDRRPRTLLFPLVFALCCTSACDSGTQEPDAAAPNVVLVVIDTLRADQLGVYGFPGASSPALDRFAEGAAIFDRAIAASTLTAPSHASLMTARFVRNHSIGFGNGTTRLVGGTTLAEHFQRAGYDTAAFIGNTVIRRHTGLDRGFALYDDELPDQERNRPAYFERTALPTTERAVAWLARPREAPYFLWVHYQDPHGPYTPPAPWDEGIEAPAIEGERETLRLLPHNAGNGGLPNYQYLKGKRDPRTYRSLYAGEVRHFDEGFAKLQAAVEASAGSRETLWLITADHGESLGEDDYWFAHGHSTTPDQARVPFLVRGPGVEAGHYGDLVHHVDVVPTLLGLAGLAPDESADGVDLTPRLGGGPALAPRTVFGDLGKDTSAYRGDHFLRRSRRRGAESFDVFRWSRGGRPLTHDAAIAAWQPEEPDGATELRAALDAYLSLEPEMPPAQAADEAQRERLKALGYIDPDD